MQRINHLSLSPAFEAALIETLGTEFQTSKRLSVRSAVALIGGLLVILVAVAALFICSIHH